MKLPSGPYLLLEREGIVPRQLSKTSQKALMDYDLTIAEMERSGDPEELQELASEIVKTVMNLLEKDIRKIKGKLKSEIEKEERDTARHNESKLRLVKSSKTIDKMAQCRELLKEERRQKREETGPPKPKRLTTKLKESLGKIVRLMPVKVKEDPDRIRQTEKAVSEFLVKLTRIWGMNRVEGIEKELTEQFEKLKQTKD